MNRLTRTVATAVVVLALIAGCDGTSGSTGSASAVSSGAGDLPHRQPPIPGLDAATILQAAKAVMPDASELTFPQGSNGHRPYTKSAIGYPDEAAGDITRGSPSVELSWEQDGTVLYVNCSDLLAAGPSSPVVAVCTDLPVTGIPAGGLATVWQQMFDDAWDGTQPFRQVSLSTSRFEADRPRPGPAISLGISGADGAATVVPSSSSL